MTLNVGFRDGFPQKEDSHCRGSILRRSEFGLHPAEAGSWYSSGDLCFRDKTTSAHCPAAKRSFWPGSAGVRSILSIHEKHLCDVASVFWSFVQLLPQHRDLPHRGETALDVAPDRDQFRAFILFELSLGGIERAQAREQV